MRFNIENIFAVTLLLLAEAWFLHGQFTDRPSWDAALAFIGALAALFAKDYVKDRFNVGQPARVHDRELFQRFLLEFPVEPTLNILKEHDFGNSFWSSQIRPLFNFCNTWGDVDKEFLDTSLDRKRRDLLARAGELSMEIARRTVPVGNGDKSSVFSDNLRAEGLRPPSVIEDARVLNQKSRDFVPLYEDFVRLGKRKLLG